MNAVLSAQKNYENAPSSSWTEATQDETLTATYNSTYAKHATTKKHEGYTMDDNELIKELRETRYIIHSSNTFKYIILDEVDKKIESIINKIQHDKQRVVTLSEDLDKARKDHEKRL